MGAICGLSASLLGGIVGMPRIVYAMARDGLIFKFLDKVSARFGTPLPATLVSGLFTAVFAALFSLQELVDMMSIGTLLAYLLVAMCVIILRYSPEDFPKQPLSGTVAVPHLTNGPTWKSFKIAVSSLCICICCFFALAAIFIYVAEENFTQATSGDTEIVVLTALCLLSIIPMVLQPQNKQKILFKVPFVPFIPLLSIFANIYLMLKLSPDTWVRFAAWMLIGFIIYFFYGLRKSGLKKESRGRNSEDVISVPITSNEGSPLLQRRNTRHDSGSSTDNS